jgi:hypothetical protein
MEYNHERQKDYQSDIDCKMVDEWDKEYFIPKFLYADQDLTMEHIHKF